jgi:hypothetical protein
LTILRVATGNQPANIAATDLLRGADVAPLGADGMPHPDGLLDLRDLLVLLRKYVGIIHW